MLAQNDWETTLQGLSVSPMEKLENKGEGSHKWGQTTWQTAGCCSPCAKGTVEVKTWPGDGYGHRETPEAKVPARSCPSPRGYGR